MTSWLRAGNGAENPLCLLGEAREHLSRAIFCAWDYQQICPQLPGLGRDCRVRAATIALFADQAISGDFQRNALTHISNELEEISQGPREPIHG